MKGHSRMMTAIAGTLAAILTVSLFAADPEDELKSVAVLSFLRYADWPPTADSWVTVGVLGRPGFARALGRILEGKSVNNRPLRLIEISGNTNLHCCQLVYVASSKIADMRQVLAGVQASHTLTIGESDHFLEAGGAVNLFFVDGHIGFEASLQALDRAGVTVSSNLLRLGQIHDLNHPRPAK